MKTKLTIVILLMMSLFSVTGCSKTDATSDAKKEDSKTEESKKEVDTTDISTNDWDDNTIEIRGKKFTMPFKAQELLDLDLTIKQEYFEKIAPLTASEVNLQGIGVKELADVYVTVVNNSDEILPFGDCYVISMSISHNCDMNESQFEALNIRFFKGLTGKSTYDEFLKTLSLTPSPNNYTNHLGENIQKIDLTNETNASCSFEFTNGVLDSYYQKIGIYDYRDAEEYKANK